MKRFFALLLAALLVCACVPAFAAAKAPVINKQPLSQKVAVGGECVFEIEVSGYQSLSWYFYNPETEQKLLATKASKTFRGLKISGKNSRHFRLSNIPVSMNGWQVYCHCFNKGAETDSDYVLLLVGDELPAYMEQTAGMEAADDDETGGYEGPEDTDEAADDADTDIAVPETLDVTKIIEDVPEGMCRVVCTRCRFTGGGLVWVRNGVVPAGTEIVVTGGSIGKLYKGYSINGGAYSHKDMATFRLVVTGDVQIEMHK
ncbi:MAG: hypothetical protein Q4G19_03970 [Clostridia bacterium]|nr:hypothetical protein [Clostridia bacterium]